MAKITSVKTSADNNKLFTAQVNDDNTREFKEYDITSGINNKTLQETADVTSFDDGMDVVTVNPTGDKFVGVDRRGRDVVNLSTTNNFSVNTFNLLSSFKVDRLVRGDVFEVIPSGLDTSFNSPVIQSTVYSIQQQLDGKILVGGQFTSPISRILRLNPDGSLDTTFTPPVMDNRVYSIQLQSDGKVLVGGRFTSPRTYFLRLNPDGYLDTSNTSPVINNMVHSVQFQSDGEILVGGSFTSPRSRILRLTSGGVEFTNTTEIPFEAMGVTSDRLIKLNTGNNTSTATNDFTSVTISDGTNDVTILPNQINTQINANSLIGRSLTVTYDLTGNKDINTVLSEYNLTINK